MLQRSWTSPVRESIPYFVERMGAVLPASMDTHTCGHLALESSSICRWCDIIRFHTVSHLGCSLPTSSLASYTVEWEGQMFAHECVTSTVMYRWAKDQFRRRSDTESFMNFILCETSCVLFNSQSSWIIQSIYTDQIFALQSTHLTISMDCEEHCHMIIRDRLSTWIRLIDIAVCC